MEGCMTDFAEAKSPDKPEQRKTLNPSRWLDDYGEFLFHFALMHIRDKSQAEELVQETFLSALDSSEGFKGLASERTWLVAILKHKIVDLIRKAGRERRYFSDADDDTNLDGMFNRVGHWNVEPSAWPNPAQALENKALFECLSDSIQKLPARCSTVFVMREIGDFTTEEICQATGVTANNLWVLLHRARTRLRQSLEANWYGTERRSADSPGFNPTLFQPGDTSKRSATAAR
jgi:RNA polymerase sigma-70 factor, ECF subfamily